MRLRMGGHCFITVIPRTNSAPSSPPAGNSTGSSVNRPIEAATHPQIPLTRRKSSLPPVPVEEHSPERKATQSTAYTANISMRRMPDPIHDRSGQEQNLPPQGDS